MPITRSLFVEKPEKGKRFAISDVHGCYHTFKAILKTIRLKKKDQLFLIGDMINRGPNSHDVLDHIIKLKEKGYQIYFIRGNHEQAVLNTKKKTIAQRKRVLKGFNSKKLLDKGILIKRYKDLLADSQHFIEIDKYFLVHAGFNHKADDPFDDRRAMLNTRKFKSKKDYLKGKTSIIGHTPKDVSKIVRRIKKGKRKFYLDNGCANYKTKEQGHLLCLDLDSLALIVQINIDC
jgi:serine/threonine protein phosphatase 1